MDRTLSIDTPHGPVTATLVTPRRPKRHAFLLAHGAGAGQNHSWMVGMRMRLVEAGYTTMTFDYAYTEAGRRPPDRLPKLLDVHESVAVAMAEFTDSVVLSGKSMGGRVGGHLVAEREFPALGVVYLGYPLVPIGKTEARSTEHLDLIEGPQLFVTGDRDRLGPVEGIARIAAEVPNGSFVRIEGGDHSFVPLKRSGRTLDDELDVVVGEIDGWVQRWT